MGKDFEGTLWEGQKEWVRIKKERRFKALPKSLSRREISVSPTPKHYGLPPGEKRM